MPMAAPWLHVEFVLLTPPHNHAAIDKVLIESAEGECGVEGTMHEYSGLRQFLKGLGQTQHKSVTQMAFPRNSTSLLSHVLAFRIGFAQHTLGVCYGLGRA